MMRVDIAPFALPNCGPGEVRFEEPRDVEEVVLTFRGAPPPRVGLSYLQGVWPGVRFESAAGADRDNPCGFGWYRQDDPFNPPWRKAAARVDRASANRLILRFHGLTAEFPELAGYDVRFRRTLGLRIDLPAAAPRPECVAVHTVSQSAETELIVEIHAGRRTPGRSVAIEGYNALVRRVTPLAGARVRDGRLLFGRTASPRFGLAVRHMKPAHPYSGDAGLVTFRLDGDAFTISLDSLGEQGPIWFAEQGVFIARRDDPTDFTAYRKRIAGAKTLAEQVRERPEQSLAGAMNGQPRPHPVHTCIGVPYSRQPFIVEPNGDLVLARRNVALVKGRDTDRFRGGAEARWLFGLETWQPLGRHPDPAPGLAYTIHMRKGDLTLDHRCLAAPLLRSVLGEPGASDDPVVALVRLRVRNTSARPVAVRLPVRFAPESCRSRNAYSQGALDDALVPLSPLEPLTVASGRRIVNGSGRRAVLRAAFESDMAVRSRDGTVVFERTLASGAVAEVVLKIPFIALDTAAERRALDRLDFERSDAEASAFWRREARQGATLVTPEPVLNELHAAHLAHVQITDFEMPDGSGLINTSVGTSTYGNFSNESCMIVQELDQRGRHEEARRRLDLWVKYQGTAPLPGNFSDHEGVFYGAGGFEAGQYNQHHGWVLWCLAEHYFLTRDVRWFRRVAAAVIAGADWVFRQRRLTMKPLPHSRGWERGFLPAGSLEDVRDYFYWLSTNVLTWRGTAHAAAALAAVGDPEAERVGREAARYGRDLRRGFETARRHAPLVRLRNGRWVPHYPSRLYCRGRDVGWIRETLEGSIYLLISGLYDPRSRAAQWILDDYQDNRYSAPPYGYLIPDFAANWFDRAGFSIQPNLLAGLMPYLDRDEPELYLWMFFNAWAACYRPEIGAMVEHPMPVLGYSNDAHFKTSDQANAVMWLRYPLVYATRDALYLGRALPRAWLRSGEPVRLTGVATYHGVVDAQYRAEPDGSRITLQARIRGPGPAGRTLARFRHPDRKPLRRVLVNGRRWSRFDPASEDVDLTSLAGRIAVVAAY